uniref:Uncharacterized protein n=1 Tax=Gouania willdenowi TaxID=441366 RepID=A0A8C5EER6_GOUWI
LRCHCTRLYLEVTRVHLQFLRVQHAQLCICSLDVVHVLHSLLQGLHDHFSMSCYFGIGGDSSSIVEVSKAAKVPLSPGVHNQTPEHTHTTNKTWSHLEIAAGPTTSLSILEKMLWMVERSESVHFTILMQVSVFVTSSV